MVLWYYGIYAAKKEASGKSKTFNTWALMGFRIYSSVANVHFNCGNVFFAETEPALVDEEFYFA